MQRFLMLKQVVHAATTVLERVPKVTEKLEYEKTNN
jgi:hypothetical protein